MQEASALCNTRFGQGAERGGGVRAGLTLVVQYKAVREDLLVGGVPVGCHAGQQGRLEPAAVLVRALQAGAGAGA